MEKWYNVCTEDGTVLVCNTPFQALTCSNEVEEIWMCMDEVDTELGFDYLVNTYRLTNEEVNNILAEVAKKQRENPKAMYRLGQGIMTELGLAVKNEAPDFYYWTDDASVMTAFIEHYAPECNL